MKLRLHRVVLMGPSLFGIWMGPVLQKRHEALRVGLPLSGAGAWAQEQHMCGSPNHKSPSPECTQSKRQRLWDRVNHVV